MAERQEHQVQAQVVTAVLAIFTQVELVHQEQEHLLAVAVAEQVTHLLAQMLLLTMAVMVAQVVVVEAVLLLVVLLEAVALVLFIFTTNTH